MAYTPLKISIPEPCHEDWNGMHPVPGTTARHCDSCAKNVVDFTGFSDAKMHAYVREQGGKLCGRFRPDQLNRPLRAVGTPTSNPLKVAAAAAGVLLAATGCDTPKAVSEIAAEQQAMEIELDGLIEIPVAGGISFVEVDTPLAAHPEVEHLTMGKITPPPPPPPPRAKVGEFRAEYIPPPAYEDTEMLRGEPVLERVEEETFTTCGPKVFEPVTTEGETKLLEEEIIVGDIEWVEEVPEIYLEQAPLPIPPPPPPPPLDSMPRIMGMVVMEHPRPTGMDWVKDTLKNVLPSLPTVPSEDPSLHQRPRPEMPQHLEALSVFPNPFVDHLKVEINLPARETLMVELVDPTGRLVFARGWEAEAGVNTLKIEPKQRKLKHALYYLRVTDGEGFSVQRAVLRGQ